MYVLLVLVLVILCVQVGVAFMSSSVSLLKLKSHRTHSLPLSPGTLCCARITKYKYKQEDLGFALHLKKSSNPTSTVLVALDEVGKGKPKLKSQDLLATYGIAYLTTSISFAIVSYTLCYFLVSRGVDVAALLGRVRIHPSPAAASAGTAAIAYAMHKAASPIRFPPTVLLTPVVAGWIGGERTSEPSSSESSS